jgi:hypothetical protein
MLQHVMDASDDGRRRREGQVLPRPAFDPCRPEALIGYNEGYGCERSDLRATTPSDCPVRKQFIVWALDAHLPPPQRWPTATPAPGDTVAVIPSSSNPVASHPYHR